MECKSFVFSKRQLIEKFHLHKTVLNRILGYLNIQGTRIGNFIYFSESDKNQIENFLKDHPNTRIFFQQQTFLKNYGVANPQQCKEIKVKANQTIKEKYGVDNLSQSIEIKKKKQQTLQKHYGENISNPMDSEIIRQKVVDNWKNKSKEEKINLNSKTQKTKMERYGNPTYNNGEAISITRLLRTEKQVQQEIEKARKTKLERYGDENYNNREQIIETMVKKYGVKSLTNAEKAMQTKLKNHTVVCKSIYYYDNLDFASSWELYYYIYQKEILHSDIQKGKTFSYTFKENTYFYVCDFLVNNENVEIKGNQYLDENNNLYFPYTNQTKVDAQEMQERWLEKQKCMKDNSVKVLSRAEMLPIIKEVKEKFGKEYVKQFRKASSS